MTRTFHDCRWAQLIGPGNKYHLLPDPDSFSPGYGYIWKTQTPRAACGRVVQLTRYNTNYRVLRHEHGHVLSEDIDAIDLCGTCRSHYYYHTEHRTNAAES